MWALVPEIVERWSHRPLPLIWTNLLHSRSQSQSVDGEISRDLTASGSGNNRISISSSANDKSAGTEIESSGNFRTSAFTGASGEGVEISQDTAMSGSYGGMTYRADSPENKMVVSSGFEGEGNLTGRHFCSSGRKCRDIRQCECSGSRNA